LSLFTAALSPAFFLLTFRKKSFNLRIWCGYPKRSA
jgi:hypothetical protein